VNAALVASASNAFLGKHLWHIVLLAIWIPIFGVVVLVERVRAHGTATADRAHAIGTTNSGDVAVQTEHRSPRVRTADETRCSTYCLYAALGSVCAALVHTAVMPDHFRESIWYGGFFVVAAVSQLAFAAIIVVRPSPRLLQAGTIGSAVIIGLWLVTRLIGVPIGPDNGATEEFGVLDVAATVAEGMVVIAGIMALRVWKARPAWRWSRWPAVFRIAAPLCVTAAVLLSVLAPRS
jgi:hypothetical protein